MGVLRAHGQCWGSLLRVALALAVAIRTAAISYQVSPGECAAMRPRATQTDAVFWAGGAALGTHGWGALRNSDRRK